MPLANAVITCLLFLLGGPTDSTHVDNKYVEISRDSLVNIVKQRARDDFEAGNGKLTVEGLNLLFGEEAKSTGVRYRDLYKTYSQAYELADSDASPIGRLIRQFWPPTLTIAVLVVAMILSFAKSFRDHVFNVLVAVLLRSFMRNTWITELLVVNRYRKSLLSDPQYLYQPRLEGPPLPFKEYYVPLFLFDVERSRSVPAYDAFLSHSRIAIKGAAGSGKSTFLRAIELLFAEKRIKELKEKPIPVLVELSKLVSVEVSIESLLCDELTRRGITHPESFVRSRLKDGRLIILLDGFDEVPAHLRARVTVEIHNLLRGKARKCRSIITSRTAVYHDEFSGLVSKTYEVKEFSDTQIGRFLDGYRKSLQLRGKSVSQLQKELKDHPQILAVVRTPLMLVLLTSLYRSPRFVLPNSRTEFFSRATELLLAGLHKDEFTFSIVVRRTVLAQLSLSSMCRNIVGEIDKESIDYREALEQTSHVLPGLGVEDGWGKDIVKEIIERCSLLVLVDGGQRLKFPHRTFMEFSAADALLTRESELLDFLTKDRETWREVVRLWCGLAKDCTSLITKVLDLDAPLALECLSDAANVDSKVGDIIVRAAIDQVGVSTEQDGTISRALGTLAAGMRSQRTIALEWMENAALSFYDSAQKLVAQRGLSYSNLPEAARILSKSLTVRDQGVTYLIRMGDIAVPILDELLDTTVSTEDFKGCKVVVSTLVSIGTENAALVLLKLLWDDNRLAYAIEAAFGLGTLLKRRNVNRVLSIQPLEESDRARTRFGGHWGSKNNRSEAISVICGRIAYLIGVSCEDLRFEPRIGLEQTLIVQLLNILLKSVKIVNIVNCSDEILYDTGIESRLISLKDIHERKCVNLFRCLDIENRRSILKKLSRQI